jgi:hypothetical protein
VRKVFDPTCKKRWDTLVSASISDLGTRRVEMGVNNGWKLSDRRNLWIRGAVGERRKGVEGREGTKDDEETDTYHSCSRCKGRNKFISIAANVSI